MFLRILVYSFVGIGLAGCGTSLFVEPKANPIIEDKVGDFRTLATTGERRIAFIRTKKLKSSGLTPRQQKYADKEIAFRTRLAEQERGGMHAFIAHRLVGRFGGHVGEYCAEPSPDSIESLATAFGAALDASSTLPQGVQKQLKAGFSKTLATSAATVFRRTQGVQLYRDGAFFLCQAVMNGYIDAAEYQEALFKPRTDAKELIKAEFATEAWKSPPTLVVIPTPSSPSVVVPEAK